MGDFYCKKITVPMAGVPEPPFAFPSEYPKKDDMMYYELGGTYEDGTSVSIRVYPEIGFKSTDLYYNNTPVEMAGDVWQPHIYHAAPWGSYISCPTPNRVRDARFTFRGETVDMRKFGRRRPAHGVAYDTVWNYQEPEITPQGIQFQGYMDILPGDENFEAFPYPCRLSAQYCLRNRELIFTYTVENLGDRAMPFGICKHPYFTALHPEELIEIKVEADSVYETTGDLLPTGRLIPVSGENGTDLNEFRSLDSLMLDAVYTQLRSQDIYVRYPERGYQMRIRSSGDFQNVVVFTLTAVLKKWGMLPGKDLPTLFCIENQTCCTDGINMHEKGFAESGLIILEPGQKHSGSISYCFEDI